MPSNLRSSPNSGARGTLRLSVVTVLSSSALMVSTVLVPTVLVLAQTRTVAIRTWPLAAVVAAPGSAGLMALIIALAGAAVALPQWRARSRWVAALSVGSVCIALSVVIAIVAAGSAPVSVKSLPASRVLDDAKSLRVMVWNVSQFAVSAPSLLRLAEQHNVDVLVLPEVFASDFRSRSAADLRVSHYEVVGVQEVAVTVLIASRLGKYGVRSYDHSGARAGLVLVPQSGRANAPVFVAAHLTRMSPSGDTSVWLEGLKWLASSCRGSNVVALGDFNSTPAHFADHRIGACRLANSSKDVGLSATWPNWLPPFFGLTIDNVLLGRQWQFSYLRTVDLTAEGVDHRPVFGLIERSAN